MSISRAPRVPNISLPYQKSGMSTRFLYRKKLNEMVNVKPNGSILNGKEYSLPNNPYVENDT